MRIEDFCEKYNVSKHHVYVNLNRGLIPRSVVYKPNNDVMHINEQWFLRRKEFKLKIKRFNEEMLYFFEDQFTISGIATSIFEHYEKPRVTKQSIYMYLYRDLFNLDETSILTTRLTEVAWVVYKFNLYALRRIRRYKVHKKIDNINRVLDIRMRKHEETLQRTA